ncbi:MAG: hypothetical protein IJ240_07960 [Clostridia bacterium]|nr:hypothetical protein [Clostridia bacterium]
MNKAEKLWSWIILIVLIIFSLVWGAYKGWTGERADVDASCAVLEEALETRAEVASNILTVAKRHLPEDNALMQRLAAEKITLASRTLSLAEKSAGNQSLETDARALLTQLRQIDSVTRDERDMMYAEKLLPQMLDTSYEYVREAENAYLSYAEDYNQRFDRYFFSSFIARFIGVDHAEAYASDASAT